MKVGKTECNPSVDSGKSDAVTFGDFTISQFSDGVLWIEDGDEDSGTFDEQLFIQFLRKFYDDNF